MAEPGALAAAPSRGARRGAGAVSGRSPLRPAACRLRPHANTVYLLLLYLLLPYRAGAMAGAPLCRSMLLM